jgi:hypothetical protein
MSDPTTLPASFEMRYEPDTYTEQEVRDGASWPLGAGHYVIGANVNGAFFPIARLKGGGVQKKLAAAKAASQSSSTTTSTADTTATADTTTTT